MATSFLFRQDVFDLETPSVLEDGLMLFLDKHLQKGVVYFSLSSLPIGVEHYTSNGHSVSRTTESEVVVKSDKGEERVIPLASAQVPAERHHLFVWERGLLSDGWSPCTLTENETGIDWSINHTILGFQLEQNISQVQVLQTINEQLPFSPKLKIPFEEIEKAAPLSPSPTDRPNATDLQNRFGFVVVMKKKEGRQVAYCFCSSHEESRDWWIWFIMRNMGKRGKRTEIGSDKVEERKVLSEGITEEEIRQVDMHVQLFESLLFLKTWKSCILHLEDSYLFLFSVTVLFGLERRSIEKQIHCDAITRVRLLEDGEVFPKGPAVTDRIGLHCFVLEVREGGGENIYCVGVNSLKKCVVLVAKINSFLSHLREGSSLSASSSSSSSTSSSSSAVVEHHIDHVSDPQTKEEGKHEEVSPPSSPPIEPVTEITEDPFDMPPPPSSSSVNDHLIPVSHGVFIPVMSDEERQRKGDVFSEEDEEGSFL